MNEQFYLGLANELSAKLGRVSCFVSHGSSIGTYHEEALKSVLRMMLPDRFSLRTGFVFNQEWGASQQGDILIVDEMHPAAYFFRDGNFAIVHRDALACVIEVKTNLDKKRFHESIECLKSYRKGAVKPYIPTMLFAFSSAAFKPKTLDSWWRSVQVENAFLNYPNSIYALNRGVIDLLMTRGQENWGHYICMGEDSPGPKLKSLSWFLQTIRKCVMLHADCKENPFKLATFDGLNWSRQFLRFGSGLNEPRP